MNAVASTFFNHSSMVCNAIRPFMPCNGELSIILLKRKKAVSGVRRRNFYFPSFFILSFLWLQCVLAHKCFARSISSARLAVIIRKWLCQIPKRVWQTGQRGLVGELSQSRFQFHWFDSVSERLGSGQVGAECPAKFLWPLIRARRLGQGNFKNF